MPCGDEALNQTSTQNQKQTNPLPGWVAGLAVLLLLAASAYALYRLVWKDTKPTVAVESVPVTPRDMGNRGVPFTGNTGRNRPDRNMQPVSNASVSRSLSGRIRARFLNAVVYGIPKTGGGYDAVLEYENSRTWVTPAQWDTQILAGRPSQYPALAEKIRLTPEQKQKIDALTYQPPLTPAEKAEFEKLFTAWLKADQKGKDAAAEALSLAVDSAAKKHLEEGRAALLKRCNEVTQILTPEQMDQIRDWFNTPRTRKTLVGAPTAAEPTVATPTAAPSPRSSTDPPATPAPTSSAPASNATPVVPQ
jgi:Spy/CpxP family protein refolding chaperone